MVDMLRTALGRSVFMTVDKSDIYYADIIMSLSKFLAGMCLI